MDHLPASPSTGLHIGKICETGRWGGQIYHHPQEQGKQDILIATAYPRLFLTKFVVTGGEVHWLWKLPTYGSIRSAIRDQEITRSTVHPNSRLKRTVYGPDLKLRRHEAHRGKGMWRTVAGDEVELLVYQARRITPDYSILPKPRKRSLSVLLGRTYTGDTRPVKVRRSFHIVGKLLETEVSRAKFDAVYEEAMLHDSSADSLHREHVDLIVVVEDTPYLVEYESGEANGADEDDDRFRITPLETDMESSDSPFGTSRDREFLRFLRKAISTTR